MAHQSDAQLLIESLRQEVNELRETAQSERDDASVEIEKLESTVRYGFADNPLAGLGIVQNYRTRDIFDF